MKKIILFIVTILLFQLHVFSQNNNTEITDDMDLHNLLLATYPGLDFYPANGGGDGIISEYEAKNYTIPNGIMALHFTNAQNAGISFTGLEFFNINTLKLISDRQANELVHGFSLDLSKLNNGSDMVELYLDQVYFSTLDFKNSINIQKLTFLNCTLALNLEDLPFMGTLSHTLGTWDNAANLINLRIENSGSFADLDLSNRSYLKFVDIRNIFLSSLNLNNSNSDLVNLTLYDVENFASLTLPTSSVLQGLSLSGFFKPLNISSLDLTNQTKLTFLKLSANAPNTLLKSLDLSNNTLLTDLTIENFDGLTSLDISKNTQLTQTTINYLDNLAPATIDFSNNTQLTNLTCISNKLTNLDVSANTQLTLLDCQSNLLTSLDVSKNINLTKLDCSSNIINTLDVSLNTNLNWFNCATNAITKLDFHLNTTLGHIDVNNNQLVALNVANGNNLNMNSFELETGVNALTNANLTCILVDNNVINAIPASWMKDDTANYAIDDEINTPDANFKNALLAHNPVIDIDGNGKISTCEADNFTGSLDISSKNISDLTGIEAFKNITVLNANANNITSLNLSSNTKLTHLEINDNKLASLDVTLLTQLTILHVSNNLLTSLNAFGGSNSAITDLYMNNNKISGSLSTDNLPNLIRFDCSDNQIQHIDPRLNSKLEWLFCKNNPFSSLSLITNTIDLSSNTELRQLDCSNNGLQDLDISNNTKLTKLYCKNNVLEKLNIANGNNVALTNFEATGNSKLYCIQVDAGIINSIPVGWLTDAIANYSVDACLVLVCTEVNTPDSNFKTALLNYTPRIDLDYDGKIEDCEAENVIDLDVSNKNISDLTGIEAFINLENLDVSNNNLKNLDLTLNSKLTAVTVTGNPLLTSVILPDGANVGPKGKTNSNKANAVNSTLINLNLSNNALTSLDLHNYSKLTTIKVNDNSLTSLNVQNGNNANITSANFNASGNSGLTEIIVDDVAFATANWSNVDAGIAFSTNSTLGVADLVLNTHISVYPNPTQGLINVQVSPDYTVKNISLYSITGQQLKSFNNTRNILNVSNLPSGIYFLRITTDKGSLTKKILKN